MLNLIQAQDGVVNLAIGHSQAGQKDGAVLGAARVSEGQLHPSIFLYMYICPLVTEYFFVPSPVEQRELARLDGFVLFLFLMRYIVHLHAHVNSVHCAPRHPLTPIVLPFFGTHPPSYPLAPMPIPLLGTHAPRARQHTGTHANLVLLLALVGGEHLVHVGAVQAVVHVALVELCWCELN